MKLSVGFGLLRGPLLAALRRVLDCFRSTSPPGGNLVDGLPPALSLKIMKMIEKSDFCALVAAENDQGSSLRGFL